MHDWIANLFKHPGLLRMGHAQRADDMNLGLGWLYYALGRIVRPQRAVVIGSFRGFVPLVLGKALHDNLEPGEVIFIDPSRVDNFWKDAERVRGYFGSFGLDNVRHFCATTQEFVKTQAYRELGEIGLAFIDGYHSEEQARFDYEAFEALLASRAIVLFHDSMVVREDKIRGPMKVRFFIDELKGNPNLQCLDLPFGVAGLTLVRKHCQESREPLHEWIDGRP